MITRLTPLWPVSLGACHVPSDRPSAVDPSYSCARLGFSVAVATSWCRGISVTGCREDSKIVGSGRWQGGRWCGLLTSDGGRSMKEGDVTLWARVGQQVLALRPPGSLEAQGGTSIQNSMVVRARGETACEGEACQRRRAKGGLRCIHCSVQLGDAKWKSGGEQRQAENGRDREREKRAAGDMTQAQAGCEGQGERGMENSSSFFSSCICTRGGVAFAQGGAARSHQRGQLAA